MTFYTRKSRCKGIKILPSAQSPPKGILRGFFALKSQFVGIGSILTSEKKYRQRHLTITKKDTIFAPRLSIGRKVARENNRRLASDT